VADGSWRRCGDDRSGCTTRHRVAKPISQRVFLLYRNAFGPGFWVQMT
jgi:hypothetical protein